MTQFVSAPLGQVCERITVGHVGKTSPYYRDSGIPFLRTQNVGQGELLLDSMMYVTKDFHEKLGKSKIQSNDVLISRVISDKVNCGLVPEDIGEANCANVIILRPGKNVYPNYLIKYISSPIAQRQLLRHRVGSAQSVVNTKVISNWIVPLPSLDEQRRIAAILDKADAVRRKRKEAIALTEDLLRSAFLEMFGDPVTNPKGWKIQPLIELIDLNRPITYGILKPGPDLSDGIPYVRVVDMKEKIVEVSSIRRTSLNISKQYSRSTLKAGDLLLSIRGHVGRLAITPKELDGANITQDTARLAVGDSITTEYLFSLIESPHIQRWMKRRTKGAAVQGINLGDVKQIPIAVPDKNLQIKFTKLFEQIRLQQNHMRQRNQYTDDLFNSLLQRAFRGDL